METGDLGACAEARQTAKGVKSNDNDRCRFVIKDNSKGDSNSNSQYRDSGFARMTMSP